MLRRMVGCRSQSPGLFILTSQTNTQFRNLGSRVFHIVKVRVLALPVEDGITGFRRLQRLANVTVALGNVAEHKPSRVVLGLVPQVALQQRYSIIAPAQSDQYLRLE